jgi:hypothetical protein
MPYSAPERLGKAMCMIRDPNVYDAMHDVQEGLQTPSKVAVLYNIAAAVHAGMSRYNITAAVHAGSARRLLSRGCVVAFSIRIPSNPVKSGPIVAGLTLADVNAELRSREVQAVTALGIQRSSSESIFRFELIFTPTSLRTSTPLCTLPQTSTFTEPISGSTPTPQAQVPSPNATTSSTPLPQTSTSAEPISTSTPATTSTSTPAPDSGCDGVPNSGLTNDACGVCGGHNSSCADLRLGIHGCPTGATMIGWFSGDWVAPSVRTYGFPHDTVSGLLVFNDGSDRFVGYQLNSNYSHTFVASGCCNRNAYSAWWPTITDSEVFADMLTYCEHARDGTGEAWRREFCGCGSVPPTTCVLQSAFTNGPAYTRVDGRYGPDQSTVLYRNSVGAFTVNKTTISGRWDGVSNTGVTEQNYATSFTRCAFTCDCTIAPLGAAFKGWFHGDASSRGFGLDDNTQNTYGYKHATIDGLYIFGVSMPKTVSGKIIFDLKLVGYQYNSTTATFAHVDGRYHDMSEAKYGHTFVATGCCNQNVYSSWWPTQTASTVFGDMLAYCEFARDGTGDAWRREFCGCGSVPPTTCVLQSAFTDGPAYPVDNTTITGLWDYAPQASQRHTGVSEQNYRVNQIVECKPQSSCGGARCAFSLANFNGNWGPASEQQVAVTNGTFSEKERTRERRRELERE